MKKLYLFLLLTLTLSVKGQDAQSVVSELYASINYDGKNELNVGRALSVFTEDARMNWVMADTVLQFTPSQFLNVMKSQIDQGILLEATEYEISNKQEQFGKIAHFFSSYKTVIKTPQGEQSKRGVNSIQAIKKNGEWKIASLVWYDENPETTLPMLLSENKEREAVEEAARNYLESIYNVDKSKLKSVSKDLNKQGYSLSRKDSSWTLAPMTYEELEHTAETYNAKKWIPENAPKAIEILDMDERIANVKVNAIWGFDYLLMTKSNEGEWVIQQILWQSYTFPEQRKMVEKIRNGGS